MARLALKRLGLVGKGLERDRRPTEEELDRLIAYFESNPRQVIPMGRVIRFAIATAMRQEEIFRVVWSDYVPRTKMLTIRDRKDPREKVGNDQRIPLLKVSGYDPVALIEAQAPLLIVVSSRIASMATSLASTAVCGHRPSGASSTRGAWTFGGDLTTTSLRRAALV